MAHTNQVDYCDFYNHLLVEELAYTVPSRIHYGKCSIIGRISRSGHQSYLESLTLTSVERPYQHLDGSCKVILLFMEQAPPSAYVEVFGEAVLYEKNPLTDNALPATSNYIHQLIRQLQQQCESERISETLMQAKLYAELDRLNNTYEPALLVHSLNVIDQPHEMITANLRLRKIRMSIIK